LEVSGGAGILVDQAAQDRFSVDRSWAGIGDGEVVTVPPAVGFYRRPGHRHGGVPPTCERGNSRFRRGSGCRRRSPRAPNGRGRQPRCISSRPLAIAGVIATGSILAASMRRASRHRQARGTCHSSRGQPAALGAPPPAGRRPTASVSLCAMHKSHKGQMNGARTPARPPPVGSCTRPHKPRPSQQHAHANVKLCD
jgi:hypothetical protein